ncbi:MAG: VWA domain-containing protein [Longimicrobiales bacterium]|nr:VWA domain-containing protein [Longimicrobiales bacterium]
MTVQRHALPGLLVDRVVRFGRLVRAAGLGVGPARVLVGLEALAQVDVTRRDEVFWALHASWVRRPEDRPVFEEAFRVYWRDPERPVNRVLEELLAASRLTPDAPPAHARRRVWDALEREATSTSEDDVETPESELVRTAFSDAEALREKDFEQMSSAELAEAERMLERMRLPTPEIRIRRWRSPTARGMVDMRRTVRDAARRGGTDFIPLARRTRRVRAPTLVVLCDISGSMAGYTRMLLRFLHALTGHRDRIHTFLFGTRLSNVTRILRHRDPDAALSEMGRRVRDWEGGTRIGPCLHEFNRVWGRRLLAQGAVVLLITDGLDRDDPDLLDGETERLRASCRRLIWLNPLLRYREFSPEARGVRAMLPHVDDFRPVHNLASLETLADALSETRVPATDARARGAIRTVPRASA